MRKMPAVHALCMIGLVTLLGSLSWVSTGKALLPVEDPDLFLRGGVFLGFWYLHGILVYAGLRWWVPLPVGEIVQGSRDEFVYHVFHLPFVFFWLQPVTFWGILPPPLTRPFYRVFGARLGKNSYPGGCTLFDPRFIEIGENCILGHQSMVVPHIMENGRLAHYPVRIGDNVTLGVNSVILAGVTIGDGATVAAGAVIPKFVSIGKGEVWGGVPARKLRGAIVSDVRVQEIIPVYPRGPNEKAKKGV